jgi:hypothetical protein
MAANRQLYGIEKRPPRAPRPKLEMPFKASRRHEYWSCDVRYIEEHLLPDPRPVYVITIFENFSRSVTRNSSRTLSEAKEEMPLVRFRSSPRDLMATGVAFG